MFLEWLFLESSFPDEVTTPWRALASSEDQRCILLSPQEGAPIISTDWGTQFNPISYPLSSGYNPYTFVSPTGQRMLFFNRNDSYQSGSSIYSHDYGSSWNPTISTVSSEYDINPELRFFGQGESCSVSADGSTVIVVFRDNREGNTNGHIWISRDYGVSFTDFAIINNGYHVSSKRISSCVSVNGQFQYISTSYNGIYRSVDGGQTWVRTFNRNSSPGIIQTSGDGSVVIEVNTLTRAGILSSDYGSNWKSISIPNLPYTTSIAISLQGDIIYCSGYGSVYYSTDLGNNWLISSIVEGSPLAVQFGGICTSPSGTNLLAVQINQGLWKGYTVTVPEQEYDPPLELDEIFNRSWSDIRWARKGEKLTGVSSSFDVIELQQAPDVRMMFDVWTNTYVLADEISKVSLSGLQDVDLTGAQENSALVWNGSEWDTSFRIDDSEVDSATVWSSQRLNEIKLLDLANVIGPIEEGRVFVRHGFDWVEGFSLTDGTEDPDVVWSSDYFNSLVEALSISDLSDYANVNSDLVGYMTYSGGGFWVSQVPKDDFFIGLNYNRDVVGIGDSFVFTGSLAVVGGCSFTGRVCFCQKTNGAIWRTLDGGSNWEELFYEDGYILDEISPTPTRDPFLFRDIFGSHVLITGSVLWVGYIKGNLRFDYAPGEDLSPSNWVNVPLNSAAGETSVLLNSFDWISAGNGFILMASLAAHDSGVSWDAVGHGFLVNKTPTDSVIFLCNDKPRNWIGIKYVQKMYKADGTGDTYHRVVASYRDSPINMGLYSEGVEHGTMVVDFNNDGSFYRRENIPVGFISFFTRSQGDYAGLTSFFAGTDGVNLYEGSIDRSLVDIQYNTLSLSGFPSTPYFTHSFGDTTDYSKKGKGFLGYFSSYAGFSEVLFVYYSSSDMDYVLSYVDSKEGKAYHLIDMGDTLYVFAGSGGSYNRLIRFSTWPNNNFYYEDEISFSSNISIRGSYFYKVTPYNDNRLLIVLENGEFYVSAWGSLNPSQVVQLHTSFNVLAVKPYRSGYLYYLDDGGQRRLYYEEPPYPTFPSESSLFYMDYSGRVVVSPKIIGGVFEGLIYSNRFLEGLDEIPLGGEYTNVVYAIGTFSGDGNNFYCGFGSSQGDYVGHYRFQASAWVFYSVSAGVTGISIDFEGKIIAYISNSTLFTSFDSGISWEENSLPNVSHVDVSLDGKLLFAVSGLSPNRIAQVSADRGQTWNLLFDQEEVLSINSFLNGFGILIKGITKHWFSFDFGSTWSEYGTSGLMILPSESGRKFLVLDSGTLTIYSGEVESNHQFQLDLDLVPTSDPGRPGVIWRDGTTLKVSV